MKPLGCKTLNSFHHCTHAASHGGSLGCKLSSIPVCMGPSLLSISLALHSPSNTYFDPLQRMSFHLNVIATSYLSKPLWGTFFTVAPNNRMQKQEVWPVSLFYLLIRITQTYECKFGSWIQNGSPWLLVKCPIRPYSYFPPT